MSPAVLRPKPRTLTLLLAALLACCGRTTPTTEQQSYSPATDPQLRPEGTEALVQDFRHQRRLYKGRGWFPPEDLGEWGSWTEIRATMYFAPPALVPLDLVVRVAPFNYPDAPTQKLRVAVNGRKLDAVPLERRWQDVRFSLPEDAVAPGINLLEFLFEHAARPQEVLDGSDDHRALAGSFSSIRIEPRGGASAVAEAVPDEQPDPALGDAQRPPIFLYLIDTLRADSLQSYGAVRETSPRIREFADDAVLFEHAWSTSAWTLPATLSLLTGLHPTSHGFQRASITRRPDHDLLRLPEILGARGYETLGISQTYVAGKVYGFDEGFDHFYVNDVLGFEGQFSDNVRWFFWQHVRHRSSDRPLFTYVHTVAPHNPYTPSGSARRWARENPRPRLKEWLDRSPKFEGIGRDPRQTAHARAQYDGEIVHADQEFGTFLDLLRHLGVYEQSLIVLTSDHGEEFYDHEGYYHSRALYEEQLRVPLLIKLPGGRFGGTRVGPRVSLVDIVPTVVDLLGDDPDVRSEHPSFEGTSLLPYAAGTLEDTAAESRPVFAETSPEGSAGLYADIDLQALAIGDVKCIWNRLGVDRYFQPAPEFVAFDLAADPRELSPLPADDAAAAHCIESLRRWSALAASHGPQDGAVEVLTPEERARLEALGYL